MIQKRQDIEQRKKALESQMRQTQGSVPHTSQMGHQWNDQVRSSDQWSTHNGPPDRGLNAFQGASQVPVRGPRAQAPRFDGPHKSRFDAPQRFGGSQQRFDAPQPGGPSMDARQPFPNNRYNRPEDGNSSEKDRQWFEGEEYDQISGLRGHPGGGQRETRGNQGQRFEGRSGMGRGGPRPSGGPVPLMALNIEKPKSLENFGDDGPNKPWQNDGNNTPAGKPVLHGDEDKLSQMGLPTSFGGPLMEEEEEDNRMFRGSQAPEPPRSRDGGTDGPRGEFLRSGGPRGADRSIQYSQEERNFGPRTVIGGPRGPRAPGPRGQAPNSFSKEPWANPDEPSWNFHKENESRPRVGGEDNTRQTASGDTDKVCGKDESRVANDSTEESVPCCREQILQKCFAVSDSAQ